MKLHYFLAKTASLLKFYPLFAKTALFLLDFEKTQNFTYFQVLKQTSISTKKTKILGCPSY